MAKRSRNEIAVGITTLVVLLLTFVIVIMLADFSSVYTAKQEITIKLPYKVGLRGLMPNSPVLLGGAKIGQVTRTWIDKPSSHQEAEKLSVYFTVKIPRYYPVRKDCVMVPKSNVLGGHTELVLEDLGTEGEVIGDGETVELQLGDSLGEAIKREFDPKNPESLIARLKYEVDRGNESSLLGALVKTADHLKGISQAIHDQVQQDDQRKNLMSKVHTVLDRFKDISESLQSQLNAENKEAAIAKLNRALDKLDGSLSQIKEMIEENKPRISEMTVSLKNAAQNLEKDLPAITEKLNQLFSKADEAIVKAKSGLEKFWTLTKEAKETLLVNRQSIDQMIINLTEISVNMKLASREVRRAPWKLLYKPKKEELKIQGLIDSAGAFAAGAERLDAVVLRLQRIAAEPGEELQLSRDRIEEIMAELESSFQQYKTAEDKFWQEMPDSKTQD